jgi:hypothetical protein
MTISCRLDVEKFIILGTNTLKTEVLNQTATVPNPTHRPPEPKYVLK